MVWPWTKAGCVLAMTWFHMWCAGQRRSLKAAQGLPGRRYRIMNEVPTLLMIGIVILAVLLSAGMGAAAWWHSRQQRAAAIDQTTLCPTATGPVGMTAILLDRWTAVYIAPLLYLALVEGGRDRMRVGDTTIRITDQPGLRANPRRWTPTGACAG